MTSQSGTVRHRLRFDGLVRFARRFEPVALATFILFGIIARFVPRGPLWLDEALSVNISKGPVSQITEHLRHDGHPPLYYALLHLWIEVGGDGDTWVRALSATIAIVGIVLAYLIGRSCFDNHPAHADGRNGYLTAGAADNGDQVDETAALPTSSPRFLSGQNLPALYCAAVFATLPFGIRYGSETRMYSLVMVLVLCGTFLITRIVRNPSVKDAALLAVTACAGLWTHYWTMWLLGAVAALAAIVWLRDPNRRRPASYVLASLAVSGLGFLPWLGPLLYQSQHTGTPWGDVFRPATMFVVTVVDFAGGPTSEPQMLSYVLIGLVIAAVWARQSSASTAKSSRANAVLTGPAKQPAGAIALVSVSALSIGWAASIASSSTFTSRYASIVFPLFALLVAAGLLALPVTWRLIGAAVVLFGSTVGIATEIQAERTQAGVAATAISSSTAPDTLIVTCPDQLAVALKRATANRYETVVFPDLQRDPDFVDWVDYGRRNADADPTKFTDDLLALAGDRPILLATNFTYRTLEKQCELVASLLQNKRPATVLSTGEEDSYFESMTLLYFPPNDP